MARARSAAQRTKTTPLGPGLHPGRIASALAGATKVYRVRLDDGREVRATLDRAVDPAFADACMRDDRTVVLVDTEDGIAVAGALQTSAGLSTDARGTLAVDARHVRIRAGESLELEVPGGRVALDPNGAMRFEGDRLVIDMAALVRVFSSKLELP